MLERFKTFIKNHSLFDKEHHLLVGASAGVDSMVLLHLLKSLEYQCTVSHMNYQLRGEDSDADEKFVESFCFKNHLPFLVKRINKGIVGSGEKGSVQMAARHLRYRWFNELMDDLEFDHLLTAHHADDSLETVLFNLTKGTGIKGLKGISPKIGKIRRPLLGFGKKEILEIALNEGIEWREDLTNQKDSYVRNRIRHKVIPQLQYINPSIVRSFKTTQKRINGANEIVDDRVNEVKKSSLRQRQDKITLHTNWIRKNNDADLVILSEILKHYGYSFHDTQEIFLGIQRSVGIQFHSCDYKVNVDRDKLEIIKHQALDFKKFEIQEGTEYTDTVFGRLELVQAKKSININYSDHTAFLDTKELTFPLKLRQWKHGDKFQPLGMNGMKKVSDFLIDNKVPNFEKREKLVVESGDEICWLVGHRISEKFKIKDNTTKITKLVWHQKSDQ